MEHIVTMEKIIAGGMGLARLENGKVIMVPFVLPGEKVRVRETLSRKGYVTGEVVEILDPATDRREPLCSVYGECGGCDLQHVKYRKQLEIKRTIVAEALQRTGVKTPSAMPEKTVASPGQRHYRSRLRLKIDKNGTIGFFRKKSNRLVPVNHCPLAGDEINRALAELPHSGILPELAGLCREIELRISPHNRQLLLVLLGCRTKNPPASLVARLAGRVSVTAVGIIRKHVYTQIFPRKNTMLQGSRIKLSSGGTCDLSWSGGCFSQVNAAQNEQLINLVCSLAGELHGRSVLDLFCGMGNFSIPVALQGAAVTGLEWSRESVRWAKYNGSAAGVQCRFIRTDVADGLEELAGNGESVDIIVLDPPRKGLGRASNLLPRLCPERIIYVSCDPATLARDLALITRDGYIVQRLVPVDMFPQTSHIECAALLKKS
jgi:23S rRNA (uracil1939-C5)-methyltransferase